ncbi:MAG TPA: N(4)-(beta-N-acetylglucosaminyl)-L-asparaginase [Bacteroidota bacterium]|nr:N(4)-(beta-N-acetylglucosaminyl)-L-asparaginase [Bacteroidota bacterium]
MKRRSFLKVGSLAGASAFAIPKLARSSTGFHPPSSPVVLSTWDFKLPVNQTALETLKNGGRALDAVENAIRIVEEDPKITSVGRGGYPDRDGHLTLDACIMDEQGNAGSVVFLEHIMHPVSVARRVMEKTPHVVLAGDGALEFALSEGFKKEDLLTDEARKAYQNWLHDSKYTPPLNEKNHDTVGLIVLDGKGNIAGGCSTSGAAWKMHGRVGDSPLIGAGLYVDSDVGGAASTGLGETVIKIDGTFLVVELMRNGASPQEACRTAVERLIRKSPQYKDIDNFLAGFVAVNREGEVGAFSYKKGLQYSLLRDGVNAVYDSDFMVK